MSDNTYDLGSSTYRWRDLYLVKTSGSILFSDGSKITEDNANLFWDNTNKRLGIGTTSPSQKLHVASHAVFGTSYGNPGNIFQIEVPNTTLTTLRFDAQNLRFWNPNIGEIIRFTNTGNVGIGITSPSEKLDVAGNVLVRGWLRLNNVLQVVNGVFINGLADMHLALLFNSDLYVDFLQFYPPNTAEYLSGGVWTQISVPSNLFMGARIGSFGIPYGWEAVRFTWTGFPYRFLEALVIYASPTYHSFTVKVETSTDGNTWTEQFTTPSIRGWPAWAIYKKFFITSNQPYLRITITPIWNTNYPNTTIWIGNIRFFGSYPAYDQNKLFDWNENRNVFFYGNVGIGTTSPAEKLHVIGNVRIDDAYKLVWSDVNLYRGAADVLKTDDNFDALALRIGGTEVITSGRKLQNIASVVQTLLPDADNTYDLGSSSLRWRRIYVSELDARELAVLAWPVDETRILPKSIDYIHVKDGIIKPFASLPILTQSESTTSSTLVTTNQRTIWRGSLINMDRVVKVEVEVDWGSAGAGEIDLYNVTDASRIAVLATPSAATSRSTVQYDVTSQMKAITRDKVIALQIKGDGTNALTVYKAQLIVYMSLR